MSCQTRISKNLRYRKIETLKNLKYRSNSVSIDIDINLNRYLSIPPQALNYYPTLRISNDLYFTSLNNRVINVITLF